MEALHMLPALRSALLVFASLCSVNSAAAAQPKIGDKLPTVVLGGDLGAKVDGTPWSSETIKDRTWILFYISPSHRDENESFKDALNAAKFPRDKVASVAVINMASSWVPNMIIESSLKTNQQKFPFVTYVKDLQKILVKEWKLNDDAFDVVIFDKTGKVLAHYSGEITPKETEDTLNLIKRTL
jgi:predicted transcriptional regulator